MITPGDIQGHWQRLWIKAPGLVDETTRVHWIQAGRDYADVRVPLARPDLSGAAALSDLPAAVLYQLAQTEGFAGHVSLSGRSCTWHRAINWHGTPETADIGEIRFDPEGRMIETGVEADYTELWAQQPGDPPTAMRFAGGGYAGLVASVGGQAVLAIGRGDKPATRPLIEALAAGQIPDGIETLFDGVHALAHWRGDALIADLATQPFVEGQAVLTMQDNSLVWHRVGFDGARSRVEMVCETVSA